MMRARSSVVLLKRTSSWAGPRGVSAPPRRFRLQQVVYQYNVGISTLHLEHKVGRPRFVLEHLKGVRVDGGSHIERHDEEARAIGERVRQARRQEALTQEEAANKADISIFAWGKIEQGRSVPRPETARRIADALDTDAGYLLTGLKKVAAR